MPEPAGRFRVNRIDRRVLFMLRLYNYTSNIKLEGVSLKVSKFLSCHTTLPPISRQASFPVNMAPELFSTTTTWGGDLFWQ